LDKQAGGKTRESKSCTKVNGKVGKGRLFLRTTYMRQKVGEVHLGGKGIQGYWKNRCVHLPRKEEGNKRKGELWESPGDACPEKGRGTILKKKSSRKNKKNGREVGKKEKKGIFCFGLGNPWGRGQRAIIVFHVQKNAKTQIGGVWGGVGKTLGWGRKPLGGETQARQTG